MTLKGVEVQFRAYEVVDNEKHRRANRVAANQDGIFHQVDKINTPLTEKWRLAAMGLSIASIIINLALGVAYFFLSEVTWSSAAFGFAFQVLLDCLSSIVVLWRFYGIEGRKYSYQRERRACLGIGISFVVSSIVISAKAIHTLVINEEPKRSMNLLFVSGTSVFLLFSMAYIKYLVAYKTDSRALRIDAFNTSAGGVMAFAVTLTSILYEHSNKIWFLDATVALGISLVFFLYGVRTIIELHSDKGTPVPSK
ncbi:transmembrane protein 163 isoform X2 [Nematostella vectensis]|uniref:transmembrane protein 163 isoform X2 n=1 Tax=Nematostella vectensis TaxID=45351 RepID=UPI002076DEBF|nr:transmembrane protein 163 isoform X2 [Nematostella vectensis]